MRLLLALLALAGLLLTPVAAAAGAAFCFGHAGGPAAMEEPLATPAFHTEHAADHSCCDPDKGSPSHDDQRCAQACAAMCAAPAAVTELVALASAPAGRAPIESAPAKAFHAHAPPGLMRPPRTLA